MSIHSVPRATVLVVDDQPVVIQSLSKLLKDEYRIQVATKGQKAIEIATSKIPPDLILLDVQMPEMDGYQVCQHLKSMAQTRDIPIIFVTAKDSAQDEEQGLILGAVDYIVKPFRPETVKARIRHHIQRTQALKLVRESEARFRMLVDNVPGVIFRFHNDEDYTVSFISDQVEEITGYPAKDFLHSKVRTIASLIHKEDRAMVRGVVHEHLRHQIPYTLQYRIHHKDGSIKWVQENGQALKEEGHPIVADAIMVDISIQKQMAQVLEESEERYRRLSENVPVGVFQFVKTAQEDFRFTYVSPRIAELTGIAIEDAYRDFRVVHAILHPEYLDAFRSVVRRSALEGISFQEILQVKKGEDYRFFEVRATPEYNARREVLWNGVIVDIHEQKQLEDQVHYEKERLQNIIEGAGAGTWECDLKTGELRLNAKWAELLGYSLEDLRSLSLSQWLAFCHPEDYRALKQVFEEKTTQDNRHEVRMRHKDGSWVWLLGRGKVLSIQDKEHSQWMFGTHIDITERKKAEEALRVRLEFERLVAESSSLFVNLSGDAVDQGVDRFLELTGEFFQVDRSYVVLLHEEGDSPQDIYEWCSRGTSTQGSALKRRVFPDLSWKESTLPLDALVVDDVLELLGEAEKAELIKQEVQSLIALPLFQGGRPLGFFGFDRVKQKEKWTAEQVSSLKIIGRVLENALEKKVAEQKIMDYTVQLELRGIELESLYQALDAEMQNARLAHQRLVQHRLPRIEGLSLAVRHCPATYIGGDFSYALRKEDKLIIYLTDITGHGLEGTIFGLFVKGCVESYLELIPSSSLSPDKILAYLDQQVRKGGYPSEYAVAILLMVLDIPTRKLEFSAAGFQNPPVMIREDGSTEFLVKPGLPISPDVPLEAMDFSNCQTEIPPEAFVFLATDGVYEQESRGEVYEDRLLPILKSLKGFPAKTICDLVEEDLQEFLEGKEQSDDVTINVLSSIRTEEFLVPSSFDSLEIIRSEVAAFYGDSPNCDAIIMGVHELVANAIEHGNVFDPFKAVRVTFGDKAVIVEDEGVGFEWRYNDEKEVSLDLEFERGRGMTMVRLLVGDLVYNQKGNRVSMLLSPPIF